MRNVIVAALLLSPLALTAQSSNMQARLATTAYAAATSTAHPTPAVRISTGVTAPKLIHVVDIQTDSRDLFAISGVEHKLTVSMIVDETGTPNDLKVVASDDAAVNSKVLAAVSQYRFTPGKLSNQPTAVPVNLEITVVPVR